MRILLVTQYFWPENFAINEMVRKISAGGHHVTVLTGKPNYPDGKIFDGYAQRGILRETYADNAEIVRVPLRPRKSNRALDLLRNYLSFVSSGLWRFHRLTEYKNYDLVFALQLSPVTSVIPAIYLSWRRKIPLIVWVQDLWPESLAATGYIRNRLVLWCVGMLVRWIYRCSDLILISSRAFSSHVYKFAPQSRLLYYGVSIDASQRDARKNTRVLNEKIAKYFPKRKFNLLFAGNIGTAQAVETLLEAAMAMQKQPQFRLVFAGSGSMLPWLQKKIRENNITNISLAGRYTPQDMPRIYRAADALVVSLKKKDILALTVPTKIQSYLNAGKPIIAALDGEGARIVTESGSGIACAAEDAAGLVNAIRQIMKIPEAGRRKMGLNGRRYFLENYEMNGQVRKLLKIFTAHLLEREKSLTPQ